MKHTITIRTPNAEIRHLEKINKELLKACKKRIDEWHSDGMNILEAEPESLKMMRQAIAKAERLQKWAYNQIASAPELLEEHKEWAKITGRIIVEALQGHYEYLKVVAANSRIIYENGEPLISSDIIAKAERGE